MLLYPFTSSHLLIEDTGKLEAGRITGIETTGIEAVVADEEAMVAVEGGEYIG